MRTLTLPEETKIVELLNPATDAAGRSSSYISLKTCHKAYAVIHINQANAATIALTVNQATNVSGGSAKAITANARIWANQDTSVNDTLVSQTAAVSFTTSAALKNKMIVIEIDPAEFDTVNGFCCVNVATGASNAANITEAILYLVGERYAQATPPSAVVN